MAYWEYKFHVILMLVCLQKDALKWGDVTKIDYVLPVLVHHLEQTIAIEPSNIQISEGPKDMAGKILFGPLNFEKI